MIREILESVEYADKIKKIILNNYDKVSIVGIGKTSMDLVITAKSQKEARKIKGPEVEKLLKKEFPKIKFDKNSKSDLYYDGVPTYQSYDWKDESGEWEVYIPFKF